MRHNLQVGCGQELWFQVGLLAVGRNRNPYVLEHIMREGDLCWMSAGALR